MVYKDLATQRYFALLTIPEGAQLGIPPPCNRDSPLQVTEFLPQG